MELSQAKEEISQLKRQTPQEAYQVLESLHRRQQKLWRKEHKALQSEIHELESVIAEQAASSKRQQRVHKRECRALLEELQWLRHKLPLETPPPAPASLVDSCASLDDIEEEPLQKSGLLGRSARSLLLNRSTSGLDCDLAYSQRTKMLKLMCKEKMIQCLHVA